MRPRKPAEILARAQTPAFLVTNLTNVAYLTGMQMSAGCVLITARRMMLFADSRYKEQAQRSVDQAITVCDPIKLANILRKIERCGFESQQVTVAQLSKWKRKFKNTKFVQKMDIIEEFRRSKDAVELRKFRRAQQITRAVMTSVPRLLKTGITELELAWKLQTALREGGADDLAFDSIVAFGTHTSSPHHHPTNRKLKKGHVVQIDMGAKYQGYCADQSGVFFTADKTKRQAEVYQAVAEAKAAAIAAVKPGVTTHELDTVARSVLKNYKLNKYFVHSLGHGVGLDIHEGVSLSSKGPKRELLKNEIITIEPGVYIPGQFGMRLEEEVVV